MKYILKLDTYKTIYSINICDMQPECVFICFSYMMKYFEEQGFGFREVDENGQTPLHCACQFGHLEAFKFLLRKGVCIIIVWKIASDYNSY